MNIEIINKIIKLTELWNDKTILCETQHATYDMFIAKCAENTQNRLIIDYIRDAVNKLSSIGVDPLTVVNGIKSALLNLNNSNDYKLDASQIRTPSRADVISLILNITSDHCDIILNALDMAGACGRVFVTQHKNLNIIENIDGHHIHNAQPALLNQRSWMGENVVTVVIDGVCDSVSELDNIFMHAVEIACPVVIFARKFSDDVLNTIDVNNTNKKFTIIPIIIPFDNKSAITLNDIALICGTTVINSETWGTISNVNIQKNQYVDTIKCINNSVIIENASTISSCEQRISTFVKIDELTNSRIRMLSTASVILQIADVAVLNLCKCAIACISTSCKNGIVDISTMPFNIIYNSKIKVIPITWLTYGEAIINSVAKLINDIDMIIEN